MSPGTTSSPRLTAGCCVIPSSPTLLLRSSRERTTCLRLQPGRRRNRIPLREELAELCSHPAALATTELRRLQVGEVEVEIVPRVEYVTGHPAGHLVRIRRQVESGVRREETPGA